MIKADGASARTGGRTAGRACRATSMASRQALLSIPTEEPAPQTIKHLDLLTAGFTDVTGPGYRAPLVAAQRPPGLRLNQLSWACVRFSSVYLRLYSDPISGAVSK